MNDEIRENFRVDEITIGHGGDRSVGIPSEYSQIMLSDEMAEILHDNGTTEEFKNELLELFKKYNDEVYEMTDDLAEVSSCLYEISYDMEKEEIENRINVINRKNYKEKQDKIELFILKGLLEEK